MKNVTFLARLFLQETREALVLLQTMLQFIYPSPIQSYITHKQETKIPNLLCLRQKLTSCSLRVAHLLLVKNYDLRLRQADSHPSRFIHSSRALQHILDVMVWEINRTHRIRHIWKGRTQKEVLRFPNHTPSSPLLHLGILSVNTTNRSNDKW